LNRDFGKLDTPEVQAVVGFMRDYDLSFYTDLHSTDGMNYQPDVTWCDNGDAGFSNEIYQWLRGVMQPNLKELLEYNYNHKTSVCFSANIGMDPTEGYYPYFSESRSVNACNASWNKFALHICLSNLKHSSCRMELPTAPTTPTTDKSQPICWKSTH
jgi:hypothetical protein